MDEQRALLDALMGKQRDLTEEGRAHYKGVKFSDRMCVSSSYVGYALILYLKLPRVTLEHVHAASAITLML